VRWPTDYASNAAARSSANSFCWIPGSTAPSTTESRYASTVIPLAWAWEDRATPRVADGDEAHQPARRAPHQVQAAIAQGDILVSVDRAGRSEECIFLPGQILQAQPFAVKPWPAATARFRYRADR